MSGVEPLDAAAAGKPPTAPRGRLRGRELRVLRAVHDGALRRDPLYGDLAPWMLDGQTVSWTVTLLAVRRLIRLDPFGGGPPQLTDRGRQVLNGRD